MRSFFLDTGIIGLISHPKATAASLDCQLWLQNLNYLAVRHYADYRDNWFLKYNIPETKGFCWFNRATQGRVKVVRYAPLWLAGSKA